MERDDRASGVATFFSADALEPGRLVPLGAAEARHARVRRIAVGDRVRLTDGAGLLAHGSLVSLARSSASIEVDQVERRDQLSPVHLLVPIADRERMMWLAEKAVELGVTSWRPVLWRRSRSVSPRGEGAAFERRIQMRMILALTQSGGAWLPAMHPDAEPERAIAGAPIGVRWLLDECGSPPFCPKPDASVVIAIGPEGGLAESERELLVAAEFQAVRLAPLTLRFETAAVAALAVLRSALAFSQDTGCD